MTRPAADATEWGSLPGATDKDLVGLSLLVCPKCRGKLVNRPEKSALDCQSCRLRFPIADGIPVLMLDTAQSLVS